MEDEFLNRFFESAKSKSSSLTTIVQLMREFKSLDKFMASDYKVFDRNGELVFTIRKDPISQPQLNCLAEIFSEILKEEEKQMKKKNRTK